MNAGPVRNLEQIQETDHESSMPKGVAVAFVALGGACAVFAALALASPRSAKAPQRTDPLGDLVAQSKSGAVSPKPTDLSPREVTFPSILSDGSDPTTALAAVRGGAKGASSAAAPVAAAPIADDRIPVVPMPEPLPAQKVLEASPLITRPRDALTQAAHDAAEVSKPGAEKAAPGSEGGYQLQVSSFRSRDEADAFAAQLRARKHKAYVVEAHVPSRGTWYRVRVGPFATQRAAAQYRAGFEHREHVVPFIVTPSDATSR